MKKVIVIGGGAAGLMSAAVLAEYGNEVILIEKNEKLGKKIYITGKGRCNLTNLCDRDSFFKSVVTNPKFLYSCVNNFDAVATVDFFENHGLETKEERGNRVFPVSDHASDVSKTLEKAIKAAGGKILFNSVVNEILHDENGFYGVRLLNGEEISGEACVIATGGLSYETTGSTGDGYMFARRLGHTVTETYPSLVGLKTNETFVKELEGLSLKNIQLIAYVDGKKKYDERGEMLFTHSGVSGPLVLTLSSQITSELAKGKKVDLKIDMKPAMDMDTLEKRVLKDFGEAMNKSLKNSLGGLLPSSMIPVVVRLSGIDGEKKVNSISVAERKNLLELIKGIPLSVKATGGFGEAVITQGGVSVKEVNPKTMESKLCKGVYFAGEVLDVDALTGGFNLQIAWSTAYAAAEAISTDY